jgi:polyisoprenoid-binding protein YceI
MKPVKIGIVIAGLFAVGLILSQCKHDDTIVPAKGPDPDNIVRGTESISCLTCTPLVSNGASSDFNTSAIPSGQWYCDKSHSNVMWESPYKGVGSLLTGRFNYFVLEKVVFDETDPTKIEFQGYVRLNTVNTGEPGRDGGCLLTTYGTAVGKTTESENIASIKTTSVKYSETDAGYIATADLTFLGVTKSVSVKLDYEKQEHFDGAPGYTVSGLEASFVFNAISDFGLVSTNIADQIEVRMNMLLRKKD